MYKIINIINNNIKGDDIIKTFEKMIAFMSGLGMGLLYKRYEKDIYNFMKKTSKMMDE